MQMKICWNMSSYIGELVFMAGSLFFCIYGTLKSAQKSYVFFKISCQKECWRLFLFCVML